MTVSKNRRPGVRPSPFRRYFRLGRTAALLLSVAAAPPLASRTEPTTSPQSRQDIAAYASGAFTQWLMLATAHAVSPASPASGDLTFQWVGPNQRSIRTVVRLPRPSATAPSLTMSSVPLGADARPAFEAALARARASGAGRLAIPKGRYVFNTMTSDPAAHLDINNLSDVTIDGQGSTLVFTHDGTGILIRGCKRLKLTNFVIEYAFPTVSLGTIRSADGEKRLVLDDRFPVTAKDKVYYLSEFDAATKSWVAGGQRVIMPPGSPNAPEFIGNQSYRSPAFARLPVGKTFAVFHHFYGGTALRVGDSPGPGQPEDIVIDNVTIHSSPGMGILAYGMKRGFAVINSKIVPSDVSVSGTSTEYDAIHILELGGDLVLAHNTIMGQGDDAINLNNPISRISAIDVDNRSVVLAPYSRFISVGDELAFFDGQGRFTATEKVLGVKPLGGLNYRVVMDALPASLDLYDSVRDINLIDSRFAILDNRIGRCNCHGILVQIPNGLVDHNRIEHTKGNAIRLLTSTGTFKEGVGALNVRISNNVISGTGSDSSIAMPWAAIAAYAPLPGNKLSPFPVNADIQIIGNTVTNADDSCITVSSSTHVVVSDNRCEVTDLLHPGIASIHVFASDDVKLHANRRVGSTTGGLDIDTNSTFGVSGQNGY